LRLCECARNSNPKPLCHFSLDCEWVYPVVPEEKWYLNMNNVHHLPFNMTPRVIWKRPFVFLHFSEISLFYFNFSYGFAFCCHPLYVRSVGTCVNRLVFNLKWINFLHSSLLDKQLGGYTQRFPGFHREEEIHFLWVRNEK
jgi:hypothetical protein